MTAGGVPYDPAVLAPAGEAPDLPRVRLEAAAAAAAVGVAFDLVARHGLGSTSGAALVASAAAAVPVVRPREAPRSALPLAVAAATLGLGLPLRASGWVAPPAFLAACAAIALAVVVQRGGRLYDSSAPALLARAATAGFDMPRFLTPLRRWLAAASAHLVRVPDRRRAVTVYARSLVMALAVALVVVPLLAAGDAVFAALVSVDADLGPLSGHATMVAVGSLGAGALMHAAARPQPALELPAGPTIGPTEARAVAATLSVVYAVFTAVQVVVVAGGADRVLGTPGLSYAEHARSGYFQLLAAVSVTVVVLLGIRGFADRRSSEDLWVRALSVAAAGLTLVCVATALQRLSLYERAFGLTMLRLYVVISALWLGLLLVLVSLHVAGLGAGRRWLPGAAATSLLAVTLGLIAINPEAVVVRRNVARAVDGKSFDAAYVGGLSADAVPALVEALPRLSAHQRAAVTTTLCAAPVDAADSWWGWNRSTARAEVLLADLCGAIG